MTAHNPPDFRGSADWVACVTSAFVVVLLHGIADFPLTMQHYFAIVAWEAKANDAIDSQERGPDAEGKIQESSHEDQLHEQRTT